MEGRFGQPPTRIEHGRRRKSKPPTASEPQVNQLHLRPLIRMALHAKSGVFANAERC